MVRCPILLRFLLLGVLSITSHLQGQVNDCNELKSVQQETAKGDTANAKENATIEKSEDTVAKDEDVKQKKRRKAT